MEHVVKEKRVHGKDASAMVSQTYRLGSLIGFSWFRNPRTLTFLVAIFDSSLDLAVSCARRKKEPAKIRGSRYRSTPVT